MEKRPFLVSSFVVVATIVAGSGGSAWAQEVGSCPTDHDYCSRSTVGVFTGVGCGDMLGYSYDSGWLPDDEAEIQVRFRVQLGGLIDENLNAAGVTMDTEALGTWAPPIEVGLSGSSDGGRLQVAYGITVQAELRLFLEWEGIEIRDTRDIPIPYIGDLADRLLMEGETTFTPISLGETQTVQGNTERFTLFEYDVLGTVLEPIEVLWDEFDFSGGFRLDLAGYAEAQYRTDQVSISPEGGPLTPEHPEMSIPNPDPGGLGYGASLPPMTVDPEGTFECEVGLQLIPSLFVEIFDYELSWDIPIDISVGLTDTRTPAEFEPLVFTLNLPDVELEPEVIDFSSHPDGARAEEYFTVRNNGRSPLIVDLTPFSSAIELSPTALEIGPGGFVFVFVYADPAALDPEEAGILLETSDPDTPQLTIGILGSDVDIPDGGPGDPDGGADSGPGDPDSGPGDPDSGSGDLDGGVDGIDTQLSGGCGCVAASRRSSLFSALLSLIP